MEIRKMAGWCLIVLGAAKVLQAIHLHAAPGQQMGPLSVVMISLLFTVGAACLWLNRAPWRSQSH
jgi:hypothetical protein